MFDLAIAPLQNGGFQLSQQGSRLDEPDVIELHPLQVRYLAERAGLLPAPDPDLLDRLSARHVGRLRALFERLEEIRCFYLDEILDHCGSGIEFSLHLRALEDLVDEMIADLGAADCNAETVTTALPASSNEKSPAISVTPARGRPKKEDAMTPAERQAKHREKQAEPAAAHQPELI